MRQFQNERFTPEFSCIFSPKTGLFKYIWLMAILKLLSLWILKAYVSKDQEKLSYFPTSHRFHQEVGPGPISFV